MTRYLPPYATFLGVTATPDDTGKPLFRLPFGNVVIGRPGFLHGGAIAGLLEIAAIGTLLDVLNGETNVSVKPISVTVDFMRGGRERETYAAARITRLGKRIANVEAFAWQEDRDKPIAGARINLMLRRD
ncbi:MAG: PaaI family thioesterase [Sphingomonas bacterium]|jgi:uncharacterized protein (TIGR00369 family)|nr:PaaI family thioesterase [Sphingomonas bacterium]